MIKEENIVFVKSQVMDDVDEGGGAATGVVVEDGVMNNVFEDISDLDRAYGRFNLRKLFLAVRSISTDLYGGAKLAITRLPQDPALNYCLFTTGDPFDTRDEAAGRVEAYLFKGTTWNGALFENHIKGMRTINLIQRENTRVPPIGKTLCLVQFEGKETEKEQYVRVIKVDVERREFEDDKGVYYRWIVSCSLSDALRFDFEGHEAMRVEKYDYVLKTRTRDTTVADATYYYGGHRLVSDAKVGDLKVRAASVYAQLVPNSQTETPLVNQALNGEASPVLACNSGLVTIQHAGSLLANGKKLVLPTGCYPGSLQAYNSITDDGNGNVMWAGSIIGGLNYETGEINFTGATGYSGGAELINLTYKPGVTVAQQRATLFREVTVETRRFNWIETLIPIPAPGTLVVAYMAQGNWYTLQDNGLGKLAGEDPSYGAGTISYVTGSMLVTLGALPDAGSIIEITYGTPAHYAIRTRSDLDLPGWTFTAPEETNTVSFKKGTVHVQWEANGVLKQLQDNGSGLLLGDGIGTICYGKCQFYFQPSVLPDPGTTPFVTYKKVAMRHETFTPSVDGNGFVSIHLTDTPVKPGTVVIEWETIRTKTVTEKTTGSREGASYFAAASDYMEGVSVSHDDSWKTPCQYYYGSTPKFQDSSEVSSSYSYSEAEKEAMSFKASFRNFRESDSSDGLGNVVVQKTAYDFQKTTDTGAIWGPQAGTIDYTSGVIRFIPTDIARAHSFGLQTSGSWAVEGSSSQSSSMDATWAGSNSFQRAYRGGGVLADSHSAGTTVHNGESTLGSAGGSSTASAGEWGSETFSDKWGSGSTISVRYALASVEPTDAEATLDAKPIVLNLTPMSAQQIVPGSVMFRFAGSIYVDRSGKLYADPNPATGSGLEAGTIDYHTGLATLTWWRGGNAPLFTDFSCLTRYGVWLAIGASFRTTVSPLKPQSLQITATAVDGTQIIGTADSNGYIVTEHIRGKVNYTFGTGIVVFGDFGPDPNYTGSGSAPIVWIAMPVDASTIRYNAVSYTSLPLNADILGVDAVRLPSDGRVPIYRPGDVAMVMHEDTYGPVTPSEGQVISVGRVRLAWAKVFDADGKVISGEKYTLDRGAGTVTFPSLTGLSLPVTIRHTVGDLRQITDVDISGWLTVARALSHDYPKDDSVVSSCLLFGDRRARVSEVWDQSSWDGTWVDNIVGSPASATLNLIDFPITVTNEGCDTDRWVFRCTNSSSHTWELISEKRGLVWTGTYAPWTPISGDQFVTPINPRTRTLLEDGTYVGGEAYMTIPTHANGGGWSTGNVIRINTIGAIADYWVARSIQQSDEPVGDGADGCEIYALGNIDRP